MSAHRSALGSPVRNCVAAGVNKSLTWISVSERMLRIFIDPPVANPAVAWLIITASILGVGVSDYLSGTDASLAIFYLVPVMLITGWRGAQSGVMVAAACSLTRYVSDALIVYPARPGPSLLWNALA